MKDEKVLSCFCEEMFLSQLNILGSHDSATAFVSMEKITRCQSLDILSQLKIGVRLLDIRLYKKGREFYLCHSLADCFKSQDKKEKLTFEDVLGTVKAFLKENPDETVIMSVKQDRGLKTADFFTAFYKKYIENEKDLWYLKNAVPKVKDCKGKIVLMRRCKRQRSFLSNDCCGLNFSKWTDQSKDKTFPLAVHLNKEVTAIVQDRYSLPPEKKWEKCSKPFLEKCETGENRLAVHFLSTAYRKKGAYPESNAKYINERFLSYPLGEGTGWILCDFVSDDIAKKFR